MENKIAELSEKDLMKIIELESQLNVSLVAYEVVKEKANSHA